MMDAAGAGLEPGKERWFRGGSKGKHGNCMSMHT